MWPTARPADVAPALGRGDVHLWLVELDGACDTGRLLPVLSDAERMVAAGHRADERRRRYIVAHAALRQVLQAYVHISAADLVFATSRFGKPRAVLPRVAADPLQPVAWRTPMPDRHRARWGRRSRHRADRSPRRHQFHGDRGAQ